MSRKTTNQTSNLPWLTTFATCLQWVSLILITLILVCPSPWEHSSISLLTITPQSQSNTASIDVTAPISTNASISPSMTSSQSASANTVSSTTSLPARYPAIQTAAAQSGANVKREPIENAEIAQQPQIKEVIPNSSFPSPLGGGANVTTMNITQSGQPTSLIQLRLGALGSCFRTAEGHESCTPAQLAASYQYKGLQASINTTASPGISVEELLPDSMTFYATILLILIVLLLCVCIATTTLIILLFRHNKQLQQSNSPSQAISIFFKPTSTWQTTTTMITKYLTIAIAMVLVVSSGIQKYRLTSAKNTFNSANPIANNSTTLQADTGNAFGFAWVSTLLLVIAFWLQRTANRRENALINARKELNKSLPQHLINNDVSGKGDGAQTTLMMNNLSRSATLPPYTPPPTQGPQEQGYFSQDAKRGNFNECDAFAYGLPSLQKAYESAGRFNAAKSSPPFSTYQNEFGWRQQQLAGSPLRHLNTIPTSSSSSSSARLYQQRQLGHMPSLHYDQSSFRNNTYGHDHTYDQGDYSYNTEVLADEAIPNTCDCSLGRNRLECSDHSTSTDSRNRRSFQLRRQNSHSTFGHHIHRFGSQGSHRLGVNNNCGQEGRSVSPAPSYWTSSSAPATVQQQEYGRQEKERQRLFMAELRAQRAAMHSR